MTKNEFETILTELTAARNRFGELKLQLQKKRSALYLNIKRHPLRFNLDKATDKAIEAVINTTPKIIDLERRILDAKYHQGKCFEKYDLARLELKLDEK